MEINLIIGLMPIYGAVVQLAGDKSLKMITVWFRIPFAPPSWAGLTTSQVTG